MKRWLILFFIFEASCGSKEVDNSKKVEYEIFGVTDFESVPSPLCVWLNDEPVFNLVKTSTFPRISNSYPIKIGQNHVMLTSLSSISNEEARLTQQSFFYSDGLNEEFIAMKKNPTNSIIEGRFQGKKNHDFNKNIQLNAANEEAEKNAQIWVMKYLEHLRDKKLGSLLGLFDNSPENEEWFIPAKDFLSKESICISLVKSEEIISKRGNSLILICSNDKLAEWKIGTTNRRIDNFLFCSTDNGLLVRVTGGEWVKVAGFK